MFVNCADINWAERFLRASAVEQVDMLEEMRSAPASPFERIKKKLAGAASAPAATPKRYAEMTNAERVALRQSDPAMFERLRAESLGASAPAAPLPPPAAAPRPRAKTYRDMTSAERVDLRQRDPHAFETARRAWHAELNRNAKGTSK